MCGHQGARWHGHEGRYEAKLLFTLPEVRATKSDPQAIPYVFAAGPVKGGTTVIAFVQDPDGYKVSHRDDCA